MRIVLSLLCATLLVACAKNPVTGKQDFVMMSEGQEKALGYRANQQLLEQQYQAYRDASLQAYVNEIGQKLVLQSHRPTLQYQFTVLDSPEVNAFALPGGYIYITRGLMAFLNTEAELAAVLGHELGHVTARHGVRQQSAAQASGLGLAIASIWLPQLASAGGRELSHLLGGALLSGYGRDHELEADRLGAEYLARAGYDPEAMIAVIRVLKNQELFDAEQARREGREPRRYHGLFASHPDNDTRLLQVVDAAKQYQTKEARIGRSEFLRQTEGMVFNDSVEQGLIREGRFYHADLGIQLELPPHWKIQNSPQALMGVAPQQLALFKMVMGEPPQGAPTRYLSRLVPQASNVRAFDAHGLDGAVASLPDGLVAVIYKDQNSFLFQLQSKNVNDRTSRELFVKMLQSFRGLSAAERARLQPWRLYSRLARTGETYATLARVSPLGDAAEAYLRLMNGDYPQGEPQAGQKIKWVE